MIKLISKSSRPWGYSDESLTFVQLRIVIKYTKIPFIYKSYRNGTEHRAGEWFGSVDKKGGWTSKTSKTGEDYILSPVLIKTFIFLFSGQTESTFSHICLKRPVKLGALKKGSALKIEVTLYGW